MTHTYGKMVPDPWTIPNIVFFRNSISRRICKNNLGLRNEMLKLYWKMRKSAQETKLYRNKKALINEPYNIIMADPNDIEYMSPIKFDCWKDNGKVISGDWDYPRLLFNENVPYWGDGMHKPKINSSLYNAMSDHFIHSIPWEESNFIKDVLEYIASKGPVWHGCSDRSDVIDRCHYIEDIYKSIEKNGYVSRKEAIYQNNQQINGRPREVYEEIFVNVGRDGELLFRGGGNHRLCIAKLLELDKVPVIPVVRHSNWQDIRLKCYNCGEPPNSYVRQHPDLDEFI